MKNANEDQLFKVEDDMYKFDFELGGLQYTMRVLEEEKNKIESMTDSEKLSYVLDPLKFNKLRKKMIEKVYGDLGQSMHKILPQNPIKAIPILYTRFKNNYERLHTDRDELLKSWFQSCDKNFHKSLDHKSFHFKSFEKK